MNQPKLIRKRRDDLFRITLTGKRLYSLLRQLSNDAIRTEVFDDIRLCVSLYETIFTQAREQGFGLPAEPADDIERAQGIYFGRRAYDRHLHGLPEKT
jgi:hypothetical protein